MSPAARKVCAATLTEGRVTPRPSATSDLVRRTATRTMQRPVVPSCASSDGRADVARLETLLALGHVELDLLVLLEIPVARARDRAEMHEDVRATVVLGDEAEALLAVEPLHGSCAHEQFPPFLPCASLTAARRATGPKTVRELPDVLHGRMVLNPHR